MATLDEAQADGVPEFTLIDCRFNNRTALDGIAKSHHRASTNISMLKADDCRLLPASRMALKTSFPL
jgi:hypothetical protein